MSTHADIELRLTHSGSSWVVSNDQMQLTAASFAELDRLLLQRLRSEGRFPGGRKVSVFMGFDMDSLPRWLHQYHNHYFNRYIDLEI